MAMKTADEWFAEYGESHQHPANETLHWICVPIIFACVLGFVWSIPIPEAWRASAPWFNWALVAIAPVAYFYLRLSMTIGIGMLGFIALCYLLIATMDLMLEWPVWQGCVVAFLLAWVGQFLGHKIEGRKPSFVHDIVFLLIGPAWLLSRLYRKIGQRY